MKINIVDIEATCWDDGTPRDKSEIIEIGIVQLETDTHEIVKSKSIAITPVTSTVSEFCTKLTGWTVEELDRIGIKFSEAMDVLTGEFDSKKLTWGSWGYYDKNMFEDQCRINKISYPFSTSHINVKEKMQDRFGKYVVRGMPTGLRVLGLTLEGRHHNGLDDALNIAKIYSKLLQLGDKSYVEVQTGKRI